MNTAAAVLPWQQQHWRHLQRYIQQQRIPQALLITGNTGLGKRYLADYYVTALLCNQLNDAGSACGHCQSCALVRANTHPDIFHIQPEEVGKNITIGQIRDLMLKLTLKPQFERYRVAIINPADAMNNAATNAFLKCLEEPNERTNIILITDKPARLPATIISRCQKLHIAPTDKATLINWLTLNNIHNHHEVLFHLTTGAPLLAQHYANNDYISIRNDCFAHWLAIAKRQTYPVIVAEQWLSVPDTSLMFWLISWIMDLIKCAYKIEYLTNPDLALPLQELAGQLELKGLYALYDLLLASQQRLATQINKQLMLEEILIAWSTLNSK